MVNQRGAVLGIVLVLAFICSVSAYVVMFLASAEALRNRVFPDRTEARYLAEAGMVLAMQRLWANPTTYCSGTEYIDINGDGTASALSGEPAVTVTVTPCGAANVHQLQTTVSY